MSFVATNTINLNSKNIDIDTGLKFTNNIETLSLDQWPSGRETPGGAAYSSLFDLIQQNGLQVNQMFWINTATDTPTNELSAAKGSSLLINDTFVVSSLSYNSLYTNSNSEGYGFSMTSFTNLANVCSQIPNIYPSAKIFTTDGTDLQDNSLTEIKGSTLVAGDTFIISGSSTCIFFIPTIKLINISGNIVFQALKIQMPGLPTSSSGLLTGTIWNNNGVLSIV